MAIDNAGNVFVTGNSLDSTNEDYVTIKYSNSGIPLWTNRYHGPGNGDDVPAAIALDGSGNVFVTGRSSGSPPPDYLPPPDYATIKYSSLGVPLWTNIYDGPGGADDFPFIASGSIENFLSFGITVIFTDVLIA